MTFIWLRNLNVEPKRHKKSRDSQKRFTTREAGYNLWDHTRNEGNLEELNMDPAKVQKTGFITQIWVFEGDHETDGLVRKIPSFTTDRKLSVDFVFHNLYIKNT
jgi:hypothetical protein